MTGKDRGSELTPREHPGIGVVSDQIGASVARILGFSPTTRMLTACEVMAANLCWIPPLVGWLAERRRQRS